jgi:hypothetical protein
MRRGVLLSRLLGEPNPFPIVRIPWDRDRPWQATFLHEVAHNLQADLGIWQENRQAVIRRLLGTSRDPLITRIYGRWHKEIFADLAALLLGGPAAAWGMAIFLAHPAPRTDPRNLAQRALADILPFTREDQQAIRAGATRLAKGQAPAGLPPRHLVSAAAYALTSGRVVPRVLADSATTRASRGSWGH